MPVPGPPGQWQDPLDEARARLSAVDDLELPEHPEQFAAIDRLLRSALDRTDHASLR